jgi:cell wall-associated NlpC family hydrolase
MSYAVCLLSVVPCRAEASDKAEMVTQLLFGECSEVLEEGEKWTKIKTAFDEYECWVDPKQIVAISTAEFKQLTTKTKLHASSELVGLLQSSEALQTVVMGSLFLDPERFELAGHEYAAQVTSQALAKSNNRGKLVEDALMYLNTPYLWGGKSPFGIDCSGFVQIVYRLSGHFLPRDAYQQADIGRTLSFVEEAQAGDLAFFDNAEGKITHVGILIDNQHIVHASGRVRIDKLDHQGIFQEESGTYTHRLRLLKGILK